MDLRPFAAAFSNSVSTSLIGSNANQVSNDGTRQCRHRCRSRAEPLTGIIDIHIPLPACPALIVLRPLPYVLPRQVRPQPIHFTPIIPDEEDEVFGGEVARGSEVGEETGAGDLEES
jgi:hypothetical protein